MKYRNREMNKNSYRRIWKFKDFVLTVKILGSKNMVGKIVC